MRALTSADLDVPQLICGHEEVRRHLFILLFTQLVAHGIERAPHGHEPRVARTLRDSKRDVAHPQTRMTAIFLVSTRTSPVLHQEERQMSSRLREILGIHGAQRRIEFDRVVKGVDQLLKERVAADLFVEGFFHPVTLIVSPRMVFPVFTGHAGVAQW